jgi:ATP synthase protein I
VTEPSRGQTPSEESTFSRKVGAQASLKLKARRKPMKSIWFGLSVSGMIGWSVTVPTLIGIAAGVWIDKNYPSKYSWTLMLLFMGLFIGCLNAWHWIESEHKDMHEDSDE